MYKPSEECEATNALSRQENGLEMYGFSLWQYDDVEDSEKEVLAGPKLMQQLIDCWRSFGLLENLQEAC